MTPPGSRLARALTALLLLGAAALLAAKVVTRPLSHDEHQFVAPSALLLREGLLPYVDYPHFHAPYGVYLGALPLLLSDHLLLGARGLSALCALALLVLVARAVRDAAARAGRAHAALLGASAALLVLALPTTAYTAGLAWNHDPALLLAFLGLLAAGAALRRGVCRRRLVLAGALLAAAAGVRLSFAPAGPLLVLGAALCAPRGRRARTAALVTLGGVLGSLPFLAHVAAAPAQAWFGNVTYAGLNTAFRAEQGFDTAMDLPGKLLWLRRTLLPQPGVLLLGALVVVAGLRLGARRLADARAALPELVLGLVIWPGLVLHALLPTPSWTQYLHAPLAWLVPLVAWALVQRGGTPPRALLAGVAAAALVCGVAPWRAVLDPGARAGHGPLAVHAAGVELARLAGRGPVLTRLPIVALEGGAQVPPALASGPFGWRVAPLLTPSERRRQGLLGPSALRDPEQRPAFHAVLTAPDEERPNPADMLDLSDWDLHVLPLGLELRTPPLARDR